jgi:multidrug efflux pump subunit AcrA (membrane-fusion protein)
LEKATLAAPVGGTVTLLDVRAGEIADANRTVVVLSDLATLEVEVNLDETDVARVEAGQDAWVSVDVFSGVEVDKNHPMAGEVATIASVAQPQSGVVLYPVTVRFALPTDVSDRAPGDGQPAVPPASRGEVARFSHLPVRAGMTADVSVVVASQEDALIVPLRAVHTEGERAYVKRLNDGQIERVEVELGLMTDTEIEITRGLSEGDAVLVVSGAAESGEERMPGPMGVLGGGR